MDFEDIESDLAFSIFVLEKELGHFIGEDYPYFKFLEEIKQLNKFKKLEKKEMDGIK